MEEIHVNQIINNLIGRFEYLGEEEFNIDQELDQQTHPITREPLPRAVRQRIEQVLLTRIQFRRSHDGAVLVPVSTVFDPRQHIDWYLDWFRENSDNNNSYYWRRLEEYLSRELTEKYGAENAGREVRSINEDTREIMDKLSHPLRRNFSYK
jgi:hypothetical protein